MKSTWGCAPVCKRKPACILFPDAVMIPCFAIDPVPPVGILYGTMTLELGGKVTIECEKTKCSSELEFKLKVFF